ncbi:hsp70 nucleotide exchange factor fes1 [Coemansia sp. S100]|nr:hsp70 nucleotide exchange factor fes1 [Coemansia sp. S17]KAJ2099675.1 hsp70 nucleotide exchange factor fes1 [Coemansia sp. S100]KAJ2109722.1 hsp70 nucleotide exchange factor fes1 [Coemansia sp. S142-1]
MESLLKWAVLNTATANEDAPHDATRPAPQKLDPAVIDAILGKPASVQMTECMEAVEHPSTPSDARIIALDDLEMLVENIDNASNVEPLGLWPRLGALYTDKDAGVRSGALWVSATALQHNPRAQGAFSKHGLLASVLRVLEADEAAGVRAKALLCVSAFIRANAAGLAEFIALDGLALLKRALESAAEQGLAALAQKLLFLLGAVVDEALDENTPEELRPAARLPAAIADLGFIDIAANAMLRFASDKDAAAAVFGRAAAFLVSLSGTDEGKKAVCASSLLRQAVDHARASDTVADPADVQALDDVLNQ